MAEGSISSFDISEYNKKSGTSSFAVIQSVSDYVSRIMQLCRIVSYRTLPRYLY